MIIYKYERDLIMNIIAQIRLNILNAETFRLLNYNHFQSYSNGLFE